MKPGRFAVDVLFTKADALPTVSDMLLNQSNGAPLGQHTNLPARWPNCVISGSISSRVNSPEEELPAKFSRRIRRLFFALGSFFARPERSKAVLRQASAYALFLGLSLPVPPSSIFGTAPQPSQFQELETDSRRNPLPTGALRQGTSPTVGTGKSAAKDVLPRKELNRSCLRGTSDQL